MVYTVVSGCWCSIASLVLRLAMEHQQPDTTVYTIFVIPMSYFKRLTHVYTVAIFSNPEKEWLYGVCTICNEF